MSIESGKFNAESGAGIATLEEEGTAGKSGEPTGVTKIPEQSGQQATNETKRIRHGSRSSSKMRLKPHRKQTEELYEKLANVDWVTAETPAGAAPEIKNSENETTEDIPEGDIVSRINLNEDVSKMGPGEPLYTPLKEQKVQEPNIFDKMRISIRDSIRKLLKIPGKVPRSYSESSSKREKIETRQK